MPVSPLHEPENSGGFTWDLRPGRPDVRNFPRVEWASCYRTVVTNVGRHELGYPPLNGVDALRRELAGYLGRVRGVRSSADLIMVTAGFAQGLSLLCDSLLAIGCRAIALEDPGHFGQREFIENNGMHTVPIPVDGEGIDVERLVKSDARAVLVTPAHQFPMGVTLSAERSRALVQWAEEVDGVIIEDDYDGEFWFDRSDRPSALQALAPDRVIYAGTASKMLVPGLRLGWLVIPPQLISLFLRTRARRDIGSDSLTQCAFAELIHSGLLDRHLRRLRSRYRSRLEALREAIGCDLPEARLIGTRAGIHSYLLLPPGTDESALVAALRRRSVLVYGGMHYQFEPSESDPALVIGYATLHVAGMVEPIREVAAALAAQRSTTMPRSRTVV
jgi:GntR family transcriptional regulator/MocR family aminotransferase